MTRRADEALNYGLLAFFVVLALLPFVGVVLASLHPAGTLVRGFSIPDHIDLGTFAYAWDKARFGTYLRNSVIVSVSVTLIVSFVSTLAGFAFGALRFPGRDALFILLLVGLVLPSEATVVPQYFEFRALGLTDTYLAVILPLTGQLVAFGTFWMRAYFLGSPRWLSDAARLDGAGTWTMLWRVLVPPARPAILTMVVLVLMWSWNAFLIPLVMLSNDDLRTAPLGLSFFQGEHNTDVPGLAAASILVAVPIVVVYVFFQRHFIQGMLTGSVVGEA